MYEKKRSGASLNKTVSRRAFLSFGIGALGTLVTPYISTAATKDKVRENRILCFYHPYTGEKLESIYWQDGKYIPESLMSINHILRDIRTGRVKTMDKKLLDLLYAIQSKLNISEPFHIISGYRTPKSNSMLMKKGRVVSKRSLHLYGKAVDIKVPGYNIKEIRRIAMGLKRGGVGYYPRSGTLHLDVGQVRYWRG